MAEAPDATPSTTLPPTPEVTAPLDDTTLDEDQIADLLALQQQYDELVADEAVYLAEYEIRLADVERLDAELALLDVDIGRTERRVERARSEVDRLVGDQRANEVRIRETTAELEAAVDRLRRQAVDSFIFGGSGTSRVWDALLDAGDAQTAELAMTYATAVIDDQQATIEGVRELEAELEAIKAELGATRRAAEEARQVLEHLEALLEGQRVGLQEQRDRADAERENLEMVLAEIRSHKAQYDQRLQVMKIESDNISHVLSRVQRDQPPATEPPLLRGPLDPTVVTSGFGPRMHPIFLTLRRHDGLDISGHLGDPIRAVDSGVVVMAEMRNGFGNTIVIDHGDKIASVYAHQSRFEVEVGDVVERGELIGRVGSTGWSTGPHLHLEIRVRGMPIDPVGYLLLNEPLDCELLRGSEHAVDIVLLAEREDCVV